ncbi:hypothetical protein M2351_004235 [Azospirillum canadense]|nr:hypothetical protein [Azospirillum canadense]
MARPAGPSAWLRRWERRPRQFGGELIGADLGGPMPDDIRDIRDLMDDPSNLAIGIRHRRVDRAPIPVLVAAPLGGRSGQVVPLHRHGIRASVPQHTLQRGPQVSRAGRVGIGRIVGKHLKQGAAKNVLAPRARGPQIRIGDSNDRQIWRQHQAIARGRTEKHAEIGFDVGRRLSHRAGAFRLRHCCLVQHCAQRGRTQQAARRGPPSNSGVGVGAGPAAEHDLANLWPRSFRNGTLVAW